MLTMDNLNVIRASKTLYGKLEEYNEKAFIELIKSRYKDLTGESIDDDTAIGWMMLVLLGYNPVTEFVYESETLRKRERFSEAMIASPNKLAALRRAMSLWMNQAEQYMVLLEDTAVLEAFKKMGIKRVRWFTHDDERRCPECRALHGKIFAIDRIPPKPHRNCRCYVEPVEE